MLRAAGDPYEHLIGRVALERGKGLAWWAAERNEPAFISDHLLDDPRVEYVPELEEERFQSLLSVPIAARDGTVIGVISAHTEAPREFSQSEVDVLVTSASLVETRVFDRTRALYEGSARDEEVDLGLGERPRRLGVGADHPDHGAVARRDRHAEQGLEALLLELGHVHDARVVEQVVGNERGLVSLGRPPREPTPRSRATLPIEPS